MTNPESRKKSEKEKPLREKIQIAEYAEPGAAAVEPAGDQFAVSRKQTTQQHNQTMKKTAKKQTTSPRPSPPAERENASAAPEGSDGEGQTASGPQAADGVVQPGNGAAMAVTQLPLEIKYVLRTEIVRDENQPRKVFDEEKLKELADSIVAVGIRVPLQVEWLSGMEDASADRFYKLVDGERRWRAAELAGVERVPVMVVDTSSPDWEKQKLAIQVVLNQQHENLSALEEAAAYKKEIAEGRHTAESLYRALGVSRAHLFGRLALNRLPEFAVTALQAGLINTSVAGLIPMIPDEKKQKMFLERVRGGDYHVPSSFRDAQQILEEEYCQQLKGAPFDTKDAELVAEEWASETVRFQGPPRGLSLTAALRAHVATRAEDNGLGKKKTVCGVWSGLSSGNEFRSADSKCIADNLSKQNASVLAAFINHGNAGLLRRVKGGACTDCPMRSGNLAEYPEAEKRPNVCTQPSCYHEKVKAHWVHQAGAAVKNGETVLDLTTYKRTKGEYVEAEKEMYINHGYTTPKKALGKKAPPVILATTAEGLIQVYKREEAKKAGLKLQEAYSNRAETAAEKEKRLEKEQKEKATAAARHALVKAHAGEIGHAITKLSEKEAWALAIELHGTVNGRDFRKELKGTTVKTPRDTYLAELMSDYSSNPVNWSGKWDASIVKRWKRLGVDLEKLEASGVADAAKKEKEKAKLMGKVKGKWEKAKAKGKAKNAKALKPEPETEEEGEEDDSCGRSDEDL